MNDFFIKNTNVTYDATPSYKLLNTMAYGTYSLPTAIADLVDNSITAEATKIDIDFHWSDNPKQAYVEIIDNGKGMSSEELITAMILSGKGINDVRVENDLGKYGLGMKTASMYACKCLTVISKKDGHKITSKRLDQDIVDESKSWIGIDLDDAPELKKLELKQGTIVRWDKLNFIEKGSNSKKYFLEHVRSVHSHLELIFHRFIENRGLIITINGNIIKPWNPIVKHEATSKFDSQILEYNNCDILVNSYILPSALSCNDLEIDQIYRNNALKYQGFFVYRNDRLLIDGGWLDIQKNDTKLAVHQSYNAVRITIDIPSSLDSSFKVDFTKSSLKFPLEIEEQLYKIAYKVRKKANELSKKRTHQVLVPGEKLEEIWKVSKKNGEYVYTINKNHPLIKNLTKGLDRKEFNDLLKLLSRTVPVLNEDKKTSASFTEEEMDSLIKSYYVDQVFKNKSPDIIYKEMLNMEPYNSYRELVQAFFEKEKIKAANASKDNKYD